MITGIRPKHIIAGLLIFASGLFLALLNILYVVDFIKGLAQPLLLIIGFTAAAAAFFGQRHTSRRINAVVGIIFIAVGCYGVYDEFYPTMDFIRGLLPPVLIIGGLIALVDGIIRVK